MPQLGSVQDDSFSFFSKPAFRVDGREMNLNDLEKKLILPKFRDGRLHFALNCASGGCPKLPRDAFTPDKVHAQLKREARRFISEPRNVAYDAAAGTLALSEIFKWYRGDFGKTPQKVIGFINKHRPKADPIPVTTPITYVEYDWRLNDKSLPKR